MAKKSFVAKITFKVYDIKHSKQISKDVVTPLREEKLLDEKNNYFCTRSSKAV